MWSNILEFGIEGTRVYQNKTCLYTYNSENVIHGNINSPRYPQNYPLNLKCSYVFDISTKYEKILFTFKEFRLPGTSSQCKKNEDHLAVYTTSDEIDYLAIFPENTYKLAKRNTKPNWILQNRYF